MEFIEEFDSLISLWGDGDIINAISEREDDELFEFVETTALSTKYHFKPSESPNKNFSFIANSSLSGGNHPCADPGCRKKNLDNLASFAALYADEVYIQNPFEQMWQRGNKPLQEAERQELIAGVFNYLYLKPLIEKRIIKYANNMMAFCDLHSEKIAKPLSESIDKKEDILRGLISNQLLDNCKIIFDFNDKDKKRPFFEVSGPEELIEHGSLYFHAFEPISSIFKNFLKKEVPYKLTKEEIQENDILSLIVDPILHDLSMQEWHSALTGTSYLCDNKFQMKVASKLNNSAYSANSSAFEKGMQHYLPAVHSQDLRSIVKLREREEEAFFVYRDKLNKMMQESKSWDVTEVSKIFRDQILPEIHIIDKKVKDWKSNAKESISEKLLFGSGAVSIGLYAGVLPPDIGAIVAALGGGSAVAGSLMDYNKTFKEKQEARKNDFYFLWQASK